MEYLQKIREIFIYGDFKKMKITSWKHWWDFSMIANMLKANNHVMPNNHMMPNKMSKRNISKLKSQIKRNRLLVRPTRTVSKSDGRQSADHHIKPGTTNSGQCFQPFLVLLTFTYPIMISCFMFNFYPFPRFFPKIILAILFWKNFPPPYLEIVQF